MTTDHESLAHHFACESAKAAQDLIAAELERGIAHLLGVDSITPEALRLRDDVTLVCEKHPGWTLYQLDSRINGMLWTVMTIDDPKIEPDEDFPDLQNGRIEWCRSYLEHQRGDAVKPR